MTLYERYNTGDDDWEAIFETIWFAQTFTVGNAGDNIAHSITSVKLKLSLYGSPGTGRVAIYATSADKPTGGSLCHVDYDFDTLPDPANWVEFSFPTPTILSADTKYAIVVRAPDGASSDYVKWSEDASSPTYTGGSHVRSNNQGGTWTLDTDKDFMFEEYGEAVVLPANPIIGKSLISHDIIKKAIIR